MIQAVTPSSPAVAPILVPVVPVQQPFLRVLHVNDSTDDQVLFQAACREGNVPFNWHVADSAQKGISYLKDVVEQSKKVPVCWPDLILLDIVMPLMSGFEVLKFVRATPELKHLPVVIFTGDIRRDSESESLKLGANLFLRKPLDFTQIVELARNLYDLMKKMSP